MWKEKTSMTINDIAKLAGVSKSTVSCVLNGGAKVGESTRARVLRLIEQYDFEPRSSARSLATRKNYQMGFIISSRATLGIGNSYFSQILDVAQGIFQKNGYHTIVATYNLDTMDELIIPGNLQRNCFDGILIAGQTSSAALKKLRKYGIPFIVIAGEEYSDDVLCLRHNTLDSYVKVLKYLSSLGHSRICFGDYYTETHNVFMRSVNKFKRSHDAHVEVQHELFDGENEFLDGAACAERWVSLNPEYRYSAFIGSCQACCGFYSVLIEHDVKCPEEISLLSCDSHLARWNSLPLTAFSSQLDRYGKLASNLLIDLVEKRKTFEDVKSILDAEYIPSEIIVRKSTKENKFAKRKTSSKSEAINDIATKEVRR